MVRVAYDERRACRRPIKTDEETALNALGERLRELRRASGWTRRAVAGRLGLHENTLYRIEHGLRRTRRSTLERYVRCILDSRRRRVNLDLGWTFRRVANPLADELRARHGDDAVSVVLDALLALAGASLAPPSGFVFTPRNK